MGFKLPLDLRGKFKKFNLKHSPFLWENLAILSNFFSLPLKKFKVPATHSHFWGPWDDHRERSTRSERGPRGLLSASASASAPDPFRRSNSCARWMVPPRQDWSRSRQDLGWREPGVVKTLPLRTPHSAPRSLALFPPLIFHSWGNPARGRGRA